ncbi:AMP-binding protein [Candidatus Dependentiae bacterium]|nr:AMP-binding protein [Candidatus Dependentiae bacterium]
MEALDKLKNIFLWIKNRKNEEKIFSDIKNSFTENGRLIYVGNILKIAYQKFANSPALIGDDKTINYKEFYYRSILLSKKLKDKGITPRDKVLLFYENSIQFYIAYFAIWQVGAVVVPLNVFLHQKELAHIVKDSEARFAIVSESLKEKWDKLKKESLVEKLPLTLSDNDIDMQLSVPDIIEDFEIENLDENELCLLLYTSGTTGLPKGVMLSCKNVLINALQSYSRLKIFGHKQKERFFSVLPLFHVFAQNTCMWLPIISGASIIIVPKIDRKLILQGLQKKPTLFFGFPALYGLLCLLKTAPLDSIRLFVSGADMLPDKIRMAFATIYGRKICSGYGLTEASPVVAFSFENSTYATDVVGHPVVGMQCQIRDEQGNILSTNKPGTLWVKGDNVMLGYYKAPLATNKILKDGWLNTGDLAQIDETGRLAIQGRSKDLIIHKGFNIYPQEIENILMSHPAVIKAAVIGREEPLAGQIPVAYLAVRSSGQDVEKSLRELCASNLAQYKIPKKFVCLDDLPMNATGKVDKKQLMNI